MSIILPGLGLLLFTVAMMLLYRSLRNDTPKVLIDPVVLRASNGYTLTLPAYTRFPHVRDETGELIGIGYEWNNDARWYHSLIPNHTIYCSGNNVIFDNDTDITMFPIPELHLPQVKHHFSGKKLPRLHP